MEHVGKSKAGTEAVLGYAQTYYDLAEKAEFDYEALWAAHGPEITTLLADEAIYVPPGQGAWSGGWRLHRTDPVEIDAVNQDAAVARFQQREQEIRDGRLSRP